ncbi:SDR family NAD(P)-dependent oxidoreductase [Halioglobus maricola]|uniref:SDR family NAD(P)-dependent oxidoreductase n=1 Tax=Halioglobus maricola TaxID=2601894 RepID=A0A5P9NJN3_9GAMM|nr:SDR family NAD(P)-dependent oxidoreductase [Halioglobus maricola]QFU75789.1 SDR family NAD(P)-dependent oxidoreductase [Halioglobus maricola]
MLSRRQILLAGTAAASTPFVSGCSANEFQVSINQSLPIGNFDEQSTGEDVTAALDLTGKVALVTGCNSGLGYETMRVLALRGAHVLGTGRTLEKAKVACDSVTGKTTPLALELSDFQSAVDCAGAIASMGLVPDSIILNAGINTFGDLELVGGIEKMFRVNYLGHVVLANQLLPAMVARGSGRIVHVSSRSGYSQAPAQGIDFDNLRGEKVFDAGEAYGRSKLANALFSLQLSQQLQGSGVTSNAIHPGLVKTNIARTAPTIIRRGFGLLGGLIAKTPAQGAATQLYVATAPALATVSGAYFEDCNPVNVSGPHHMTDAKMAAELWAVTEEMTAGFTVPWASLPS